MSLGGALKQTDDQRQLVSCPRVSVGGIRVDAVHDGSIGDLLRVLLEEPRCHHVVTLNLDYARQAASDPPLRRIIDSAALVVPDGMPIVWAAKLSGAPISRRVTGHDLVQALVEHSARDGFSLFFLGAAPGVGEQGALNLRQRYPNVRIAGTYSPPLGPYPYPEEEDRHMVETVNASGADVLLVALGCPKQDLWIAAHQDELKPSLAIGVGSVLDVLAGAARRAPRWLQGTGLEWLYRLIQEPGRLWRRYLVQDAPFLVRLFLWSVRARLRGK